MTHRPSPPEPADGGPRTYGAEWNNPRNPAEICGVNAGESGVTLWWRSGPTPNDEFGRHYSWEQWFGEGTTVEAGGPQDLLTQIDRLARRLGKAPAPRPTSSRGDLEMSEEEQHEAHRRHVQVLREQAEHDTPETLTLSAPELRERRARMVRYASALWDVMQPLRRAPGAAAPEVNVAGTRTTTTTPYLDAAGRECFRLIEVADRWLDDETPRVGHALTLVSSETESEYLQLWHVGGALEVGVQLATEQRAIDYLSALRAQHGELVADTSFRASIRHTERRPAYTPRWFGEGPARTWHQRLIPPRPTTDPSASASRTPTWSAGTRALLQWSPGSTAELRALALASGLHWIVPIGTTTYGCWLGVRLLGGVPLERCPVVLCNGPNVATIATELADSMAILLWWLGPRHSLQNLQQLQDRWTTIEQEVVDQAEPFGGEAAVERFRRFLQKTPDRDLEQPVNSSECMRATARVISQLDPLQAGFRDQVVALFAGEDRAEIATPRAWQEALAATRYVKDRRNPELAWQVARGVPSVDTGARLVVGHFVNPKMDWSGADITLAARVALGTPRDGLIARAVRAQHEARQGGGRYDGLAHLEAAVEAALADDHGTAWTLLAGAGYWTQVRHGKANPIIADAARHLCREAGWPSGPWE